MRSARIASDGVNIMHSLVLFTRKKEMFFFKMRKFACLGAANAHEDPFQEAVIDEMGHFAPWRLFGATQVT